MTSSVTSTNTPTVGFSRHPPKPAARRKISVRGSIRKSRSVFEDEKEVPGQYSLSRRESSSGVVSPTSDGSPFNLEVSAPPSPARTQSPPGSTQRSRSPTPEKEEPYEPYMRQK
ncbi:hypothetical protein Avbf_00889 [Armadillidium vulgare]|nr:hypothetical protein Avbf_00889 [Armadillidium vulgare]